VPQYVEKKVVVEKHHSQKPDFHVVAKQVQRPSHPFLNIFAHKTQPQTHHILVKAPTPTVVHHHSITEPCDEKPSIDYSHATSHLQAVKPVYGAPVDSSANLHLIRNAYSAQSAYAQGWTQGWDQNSNQGWNQGWNNNNPTLVRKDTYVGPTPLTNDYWNQASGGIKFKRNASNGRSLRIEYGGFKPKISPSQEINDSSSSKKKE
jgi:hypothetical protein